jgi:hypothetical protein
MEPAGISQIKKSEYLKDKINGLTMNIKNNRDLYRGISEFRKGYQPTSGCRVTHFK